MSPREELGRFGHHPDQLIDWLEEVQSLEVIADCERLGLTGFGHEDDRDGFDDRIERALSYRVGGDAGAVEAMQGLRRLATARGFDLTRTIAYFGQPIPRDPSRVMPMPPLVYRVLSSSAPAGAPK